MRVVTHEFYDWARPDEMRIVPIGDIHAGAKACDEKLLDRVINRIEKENLYWIGLGDYCDFINRKDPRFDPHQLADWLMTADALGDLAGAQSEWIRDKLRPIASRCLALVKGNHEAAIHKHSERDIYNEIVIDIKENGGMSMAEPLGVDYYGWLNLKFYSTKKGEKRGGLHNLVGNLHHGFVGGKLAGGKALNMQRWLWTHDCDFALFGHSHNTSAQNEAVEGIDRNGNTTLTVRKGAYGGTFLRSVNDNGPSTYSEVKGYFPLPMNGIELVLRPGAEYQPDRVKIIS